MSDKKLSVTGTGDSLFVVKFPPEYDTGIKSVSDFIQACDVKLTNLETNLSDFEYFGNAYSGGTWLSTRRKYVEELFRYGFNYFGNANNHCMDYSYNGLLSTIDTLDQYGVAHSGTGRSLEEAAKPAILNAKGMKIAVFSVDASFENPSRAGRATKVFPARPGVNYVRHETVYKVDEEDIAAMQRIAEKTRINFGRESSIKSGYATPDKEGYFYLGRIKFTTKDDVPETYCNAKDKKRIMDSIREARKTCDYVFLMVHCHDCDNVKVENPPAYLKEFAHACIDAGVSAVFGGGCHRLRGIEMYQNCPIFYSLGDFIYQGPQVEHLPADFMEQYDVDIFATAEQALWVRSRGDKVGLHCSKANYQTVLPRLEFENGKMTSFSLLPVYLNFERKDAMKGLPTAAEGKEAEEIRDILNRLSAPFGVQLKLENGKLILA